MFKYSQVFVQIIVTAILARLLKPEEFGVVAVVTVFINFFNVLSESGLSAAVIQKKELNENDLSSLFSITVIYGILLAFLFAGLGHLIAEFYKNDVYINISYFLAITLFFSTINTIPAALVYKQKKFKEIGIRNLIIQLISGLFAIILAFNNFSYYAIIYSAIIASFFLFIINFRISGFVYSKIIRFSVLNKIFKYSLFQFMFSIINYFSKNLDNLLIGKYLGPSSLGYYDRAYKLMVMPIDNLTQVITPVLHPVLSNYQNDTQTIFITYSKIIKILSLIAFPLSVYLFFSAHEIILIFYGNQWIASIQAFKYLALAVGFRVVLTSSGSIFQALGRTDYLFKAGLFGAISTTIAILTGLFLFRDYIWVALLISVAYFFDFIQAYYLLINRLLKINFKNFIVLFYPSLIIALIFIVFNLFLNVFIEQYNLIISLSIRSVLCAASFFVLIYLLGEFNTFKVFFKRL